MCLCVRVYILSLYIYLGIYVYVYTIRTVEILGVYESHPLLTLHSYLYALRVRFPRHTARAPPRKL